MLKEEFLEPLGMSIDDLAQTMGVDQKIVHDLCHSHSKIDVEMALSLSKVFSTTPEFWLNLQTINGKNKNPI